MRQRCVAVVGMALSVGLLGIAPAGAAADELDWPDEIAPIAEKVEKIRGLEFDHAVPVHFLSDAEFDAKVRSGQEPADPIATAFLEQKARTLRSLGHVPQEFEPSSLVDARAAGIAGLFDGTEIRIRGDASDPRSALVLAHELTHALVRQSFVEPIPVDELALRAVTALAEGEASWVESRYLASLPKATRAKILDDFEAKAAAQPAPTPDVPEVLRVDGAVPYSFGTAFVAKTVATGGTAALDALWASPPTDDVGFFDLLQDPTAARGPALYPPSFDIRVTDGLGFRVGAFGILELLATALDPVAAVTATTGYEADSAEVYHKVNTGFSDCTRLAITARDEASRIRLDNSLTAWADATQASPPLPDTGDALMVARCAEGPYVPYEPGRVELAARLALLRNWLIVVGSVAELSTNQIRCVLHHYIDDGALLDVIRPRAVDEAPVDDDVIAQDLAKRRHAAVRGCDVKLPARNWADPQLVG